MDKNFHYKEQNICQLFNSLEQHDILHPHQSDRQNGNNNITFFKQPSQTNPNLGSSTVYNITRSPE